MEKHIPKTFGDRFAKRTTKLLRWCADTFFSKRYGHRAIVLETVAAVPGMVSGVFMHFKSLRSMQTGYGPKLREMLAEAENERMHLMTFIQIAQPSRLERILVILAQFIFIFFYSILYILNTIDFITFSSLGNAQDFGDLIEEKRGVSGLSDSHGGLGGF